MIPFMNNPRKPRPEELAAYADGELSPEERRRIEAWLATHPESAQDLTAHQDLADLFHATPPVEPSRADWNRTFNNIEQAMDKAPVPLEPRGLGRRLLFVSGSLVTAAALLLLACTIDWTAAEPLSVASVDDIEIISVDPDDRDSVVVGDLPNADPLVLAAPGDVVLKHIIPAEDGQAPDVRMPTDGQDSPIIVFNLEEGG